MLEDTQAFASFSVNDLEKAKDFYNNTLKIDIEKENDTFFNLALPSDQYVAVYEKPNHKPATYTILNFIVENIDESVKELKQAGIEFKQYNINDMSQDEDGIFRTEEFSMAWFEDTSGNTLALLQQE